MLSQWWTSEHGTTDAMGELKLRGFLGTYQATVSAQSRQKTQSFTLDQAGASLTIVLD